MKFRLLYRMRWVLFLVVIIICLCFFGYTYAYRKDLFNKHNSIVSLDIIKENVYTQSFLSNDENNNLNNNLENKVVEKKFIAVDIKGRVKKPGVYRVELSNDKRVTDVITMAGGVLDDADTSVTNLAKKVYDEMVIIIYSKDEVLNFGKTKDDESLKNEYCKEESDSCIENEEDKEQNNTVNKIININTATLDELMTLTGIGESKAIDIINYRKDNPFKTIDELKNVKGIGESVFNKIKDNITV